MDVPALRYPRWEAGGGAAQPGRPDPREQVKAKAKVWAPRGAQKTESGGWLSGSSPPVVLVAGEGERGGSAWALGSRTVLTQPRVPGEQGSLLGPIAIAPARAPALPAGPPLPRSTHTEPEHVGTASSF